MELDTILKLAAIGLFHWMLAPLALVVLADRRHVLGKHKIMWALAILFLTCFGSLLFLMLHPQPQPDPATERRYPWR